jgi:hypothetical protein
MENPMRSTLLALFAGFLAAAAAHAEVLASPPGISEISERQARDRIEAIGYTGVSDLRLDGQGLWHGRASRNGEARDVGLDAQGNLEDAMELAALTMFDCDTGELRVAEAH